METLMPFTNNHYLYENINKKRIDPLKDIIIK